MVDISGDIFVTGSVAMGDTFMTGLDPADTADVEGS